MFNLKKKYIYLLISGGIDSFACAILLKILKYKIKGLNILNWNFIKRENIIKIIKNLSKILNIEIKIFNLNEIYKKKIFFKFLKNYKNFNIINPDNYCNKIIKFKIILKIVNKKYFCSKIVTGHYSSIEKNKRKKYFLKSCLDKNRDQNYFIYNIKKKKIFYLILPIANLFKKTIKKLFNKYYEKYNYKKSSKGICFIENKKISFFINYYIYKKIIYNLKNLSNFKNYRLNFKINIKNFFSNIIIIENIKIKKKINIKFIKFKSNHSKKFEIALFRKINDKIILIFDKKNIFYEGQNICIYFKNNLIGGGIIKF